MKNTKSIIKYAVFGSALSILLSSCAMQDDLNKRFDNVDKKINENEAALNAQNTLISNINDKLAQLDSTLEKQGDDIGEIKDIVESHEKTFEQVVNEQTGLILRKYFDSYARQPEASVFLNQAKNNLLSNMNAVETIGKAYAFGSIGGTNYGVAEMYNEVAGEGIFSCISRQPEVGETCISIQENTIHLIATTDNDLYCEMIGLSVSSLYDGIARTPDIIEKMVSYEEYITQAITNVETESYSISIGYSSTAFFESVARQPSAADDMWLVYKDFIDSLVK